MRLFGRAARKACLTGLAAGTLYFLVIGALTVLFGVLTADVPPLLWLVLFVGTGAGLGLLLGLASAASLAVVLPRVDRPSNRPGNRPSQDRSPRVRLAGGVAAGVPVLALTLLEQTTGAVGALSADFGTVVLIPTAIAVAGGAAAAPSLLRPTPPPSLAQ
ncbi:MAG TPA: hypothetical protein VMT27_04980 [Actinomycetes bacterium]|nr:hypothetical protein [Actinomycetes bacterium]